MIFRKIIPALALLLLMSMVVTPVSADASDNFDSYNTGTLAENIVNPDVTYAGGGEWLVGTDPGGVLTCMTGKFLVDSGTSAVESLIMDFTNPANAYSLDYIIFSGTSDVVVQGFSGAVLVFTDTYSPGNCGPEVGGTAVNPATLLFDRLIVYAANTSLEAGIDNLSVTFTTPTATPVPPTDTPAPPTDTPIPPTDTPIPPTDTPVPPTDTLVPSTDTPVPPTNTPVPPTDTPAPPTDTPVPPTDTPIVPTDTPDPFLSASAVCNGPDLEVTIFTGDPPFDITASAGINMPVTNVGPGLTIINGPEKWDNLTVTETSGDNQTLNLGQFKCRSAERPVPLTPAHGSRTTNPQPTFTWTAISGASNYRIFIFDDPVPGDRTVDIRQNSGGPTQLTVATPLPVGRLFWRVRGRQNRLWSLWSIRFTLFRDPPPPQTPEVTDQ
ncbi:MAG: hypothetical protein L0154_04995 [Chloroflexi bacterium]|nr:hypothetical protein [Chloroflexota bacterium]